MAKSSNHETIALTRTELPIIAAVEQMGRDMMAEAGELAEPDTNALEFYGEWYMESLSIAGYSCTLPEDRRSCRAFAHLIRVKADDLKRVKQAIGFRSDDYHDFAICDTILGALALDAELAPALSLLAVPAAKSKGPFYAHRREFDVLAAVKSLAHGQGTGSKRKALAGYLATMVKQHKGTQISAADDAAIKLAGLFRLNQDGLKALTAALVKAGASDEQTLKVTLAHVVLAALRADARFAYGIERSQPVAKK